MRRSAEEFISHSRSPRRAAGFRSITVSADAPAGWRIGLVEPRYDLTGAALAGNPTKIMNGIVPL
jgi:hypothetical protein